MHSMALEILQNSAVTELKAPHVTDVRNTGPHIEVHYASSHHYQADKDRITAIAEKNGLSTDITRRGTSIRRIQLPPKELTEWHQQRVQLKFLARIQPGKGARLVAEILDSLKTT